MTVHTIKKSTHDAAKKMAAEGLGVDDLIAKLGLSRPVAKFIVLGRHPVRKASA